MIGDEGPEHVLEVRSRSIVEQVKREMDRYVFGHRLDAKQEDQMIRAHVRIGILEDRLRIAYAALKRAGIELTDVTSLDEKPGLHYMITEYASAEERVNFCAWCQNDGTNPGGYWLPQWHANGSPVHEEQVKR